jgi:hypothetical protein
MAHEVSAAALNMIPTIPARIVDTPINRMPHATDATVEKIRQGAKKKRKSLKTFSPAIFGEMDVFVVAAGTAAGTKGAGQGGCVTTSQEEIGIANLI